MLLRCSVSFYYENGRHSLAVSRVPFLSFFLSLSRPHKKQWRKFEVQIRSKSCNLLLGCRLSELEHKVYGLSTNGGRRKAGAFYERARMRGGDKRDRDNLGQVSSYKIFRVI